MHQISENTESAGGLMQEILDVRFTAGKDVGRRRAVGERGGALGCSTGYKPVVRDGQTLGGVVLSATWFRTREFDKLEVRRHGGVESASNLL
jgi:hypothetical protein